MAEAYLKSLNIPGITVISSGTVASKHKEENLENFPKTLGLLKQHGIAQYAKDHYADDTQQDSLDSSDVVVFLNKVAYDEAASSFRLPERTYVWHVADIGEEGRIATTPTEYHQFAEDAFQEIVQNVDQLATTLKPR